MSGHSKWHNIQKTKGAADAKRAQTFTKIAREIIVAVKQGGSGDPANNSSLAQVIAKAGYDGCFRHGFGHSLGIEVHEMPGAGPCTETPLPAGTVLSAEPGIYLPGRFGVRIEDVIVIRENGCLNMTNAPKNLLIL